MNLAQFAGKPFPLLLLCSFMAGLGPQARSASLESLVASNTAFGLNLYGQLAINQGNLFISPYSISTALAMTYAGAGGDTAQQMAQVLGFGTDQAQFTVAFGELERELELLQEQRAIELNIANALWTQEGYPFLSGFLGVARDQYQASIGQVDFITQAEAVAQEINAWVAQRTRNKIQNILPRDSLSPLTRLVLANAVYFKGLWASPFAETNTSLQPFHLSSSNQVKVLLMHQTLDSVQYVESGEFQAIELPYGSNQASMVILLPRQVDGLGLLEQQLSPAFLSAVLEGMQAQEVEIFLPRFTLESAFNLNEVLAQMGMPDAFEPSIADFSGIDGVKDLFVSAVLHKAWCEVNEEGTEAAAATVVVGEGEPTISGWEWYPPVFRADHPFLFFIRDNQSGSLLFIGRLSQPGPAVALKNVFRKNAAPVRPSRMW